MAMSIPWRRARRGGAARARALHADRARQPAAARSPATWCARSRTIGEAATFSWHGLLLPAPSARAADDYPAVLPGLALQFPRDFGSHPAFRLEWWYLTACVTDASGAPYGVQITFFRNRPRVAEEQRRAASRRGNCCLRMPRSPIRDARACATTSAPRARASASPAPPQASTDVWIDDWSLKRAAGRLSGADRGARFRLRPALRADAAAAAAGRCRLLAQGPGPAPVERLLQRAAARGQRPHRRRRALRRHRHRMARSRMVERGPGRERRRLGLDRHQSRRRRGTDGVSHPRPCRRQRSGRAGRCAPRWAGARVSRRTKFASRRGGNGDRREPASSTRSR